MQHFNEQLHDHGTFGEQKSEQDTVKCDYKTTCGGGRHKQMTDRAMVQYINIYIHRKYSF